MTFRNLSGYYCFTDVVPSGNYKLSVESDLYFTEEKSGLYLTKEKEASISSSITPYITDKFIAYPSKEDIIITKLSLAVRLIDEYTGENPIGGIKVTLKKEGEETLHSLDLKKPVLEIALKPKSAYPFPAGSTLIRAVVHDSAKKAIPDASVQATVFFPEDTVRAKINQDGATAENPFVHLTEISDEIKEGNILMIKDSDRSYIEFCKIKEVPSNSATAPFKLVDPLKFDHSSETPLYLMIIEPFPGVVRAKVNQGGVQAGDSSIYLSDISDEIKEGDILMIKDSNREHVEYCKIVTPLPGDPAVKPFNLDESLKFDHPSGTPVYLTLATKTTKEGELVIYFRTEFIKAGNFLTRLKVSHENYKPAEPEIRVHEGCSTSLGIIQLSAL